LAWDGFARIRSGRNQGYAGKVSSVAAGISGEQSGAEKFGMGANEEVGEDVGSRSTATPLLDKSPACEEGYFQGQVFHDQIHFLYTLIHLRDGAEGDR